MRFYNKSLLIVLIFLSGFVLNAQKDLLGSKGLKGELENQFDYVFRNSANYEKYKIVSKFHFEHLKKSSIDSLKKYKKEIDDVRLKQSVLMREADSMKVSLNSFEKELLSLKKTKDSFSFFGMNIKKGVYNIIVFGILGFLLLILGLFLMKYKNAKNQTDIATENLSKIEEEYEDYKRRAMEKEQTLGRKLQDEINKQKTKKNNK